MNKEIKVEKMENIQAPCHGCYFAAGVGTVATVAFLISLT